MDWFLYEINNEDWDRIIDLYMKDAEHRNHKGYTLSTIDDFNGENFGSPYFWIIDRETRKPIRVMLLA